SSPDPSTGGTPVDNPTVAPSVPTSSLQPAAANQKLSLSVGRAVVPAGAAGVLTASAGAGASAIGVATEIFDASTGALVGACAHGGRCAAVFLSTEGVQHFLRHI